VRASRVVQRQDVRVLQVGRNLNLLKETLRAECRGELRLEHLERDFSVVPDVVRQVHGCHTALAELSLEGVAIGECSLELFEASRELGHDDPVGGWRNAIQYDTRAGGASD